MLIKITVEVIVKVDKEWQAVNIVGSNLALNECITDVHFERVYRMKEESNLLEEKVGTLK